MHEQMKGIPIFHITEQVIKNLKAIFSNYVDDIANSYNDDDFNMQEMVKDLEKYLIKFNENLKKLEYIKQDCIICLDNIHIKVLNSLDNFNLVNENYKEQILDLEMDSKRGRLSERISASWNIITHI